MDKAMRGTLIFVCSLVLLSSVLAEQPLVADDRSHPEQKPRLMVHRIMSSASSLNREKLATLACQAHAYFFPPRTSSKGGPWGDGKGGGAAKEVGEKVKEAVAKSVEKGKSAVKGSAKSATKMADASAHKAAKKVKKTLSEL
ncbi:hypothetical protein NL676_006986 [Syzygium grande]|nr:hypothetical protein NL676_006986 [Syzygium grande]